MKIDRILANNPGVFTGPGTNTWVLDDGHGEVVIIDPGPVDTSHAKAVMKAVGTRKVVSVLVTHTHLDHAPLANPLARDLDVPAVGYAPGPLFEPDERLLDGATLPVGQLNLKVVHTPGHADDHLCFRARDVLFTGDHILGGSSVMVESMGPYLKSLEKLRNTGLERLHPGHGPDMEEPDAVIDWYIAHRRQRHEQVLAAVVGGYSTAPEIVQAVYTDVDPSLYPLAEQSVLAHLILLNEEGRIALEGNNAVAPPNVT